MSTIDIKTEFFCCARIIHAVSLGIFSLADPICEEDNEHEEEFYYSEIEIPLNLSAPQPPAAARFSMRSSAGGGGGGGASSSSAKRKRLKDSANSVLAAAALPVLADHMDMARPPHENPEYYRDGSELMSCPYS